MSYCFFIAAAWGKAAIPLHFQTLSRELVSRGHRVVYLPHGRHVELQEGDFHVHSFPSPRPTQPRDFLFLHRLVRQYKPDCMIANFGAVNVMTVVGWLNRIPCRVNWYHTPNSASVIDGDTGIMAGFFHWRKWLVYRLNTHVIANSSYVREDVIKTFHVPSSKVESFYNTIANPNISAPARDPNRIICVGRFDPVKGQDVLIRALALLKDEFPQVRLQLVGAGRLEPDYRQLAAELGLTDRIIFRGLLSPDEVLLAMASSAVTVVPSRSEAFGLVNIESMSVGTPVIASWVGGIPEVIRDGIDGFLVPPDDPAALADKLRIVLRDSTLRAQMGRSAQDRFLDKFERTKNIGQQADWFEDLVRTQHKEANQS